MRTIDTAAEAVLEAGGKLPLALLVNMQLDTPLLLCTGRWNLTWSGDTYQAVGLLGEVSAPQENGGGPRPLTFQLSGVPASMRSLVLQEQVQGKECTLYLAILDPTSYQVLDAVLEWAGTLDVMTWRDDGTTGVVSVTAENAGADLLRGVAVRYTHQDQQRLFPGDLGFEYVIAQGEKKITWPAASFYRR